MYKTQKIATGAPFLIIPFDLIETETLSRLIEEFVSREGTDNGYEETLTEKAKQVLSRLKCGEMVIVFDHESQTANILPKDLANKACNSSPNKPL